VVSQQVKGAIPTGLYCRKSLCPYCEAETDFCEVMGEKINPEYKICGLNKEPEIDPLTKDRKCGILNY
jgi:hypothetical protein